MLRLENTNMILYKNNNDNNNNKKWKMKNENWKIKNKNKRNGQDLIMTQEIIWMYDHFDISIKAKLRIIK